MLEKYNKFLEPFNRITFNADAHQYFIDDSPSNELSVTKAIKLFKKKFDAETTSERISRRTGQTKEQIIEGWERNRDCSALLGTSLHKYIECYFNEEKHLVPDFSQYNLGFEEKTKIANELPVLIEQFHCFYNDHQHYKVVKNELSVGDLDDTKICGTLDMLVYNEKTKQLEILDFKTNKRMQRQTSFGNLFYPFEKFSEGEINEYTIQLNTYKYFVEKYTDLKIESLKLVWFNVQNKTYQVFELKDIQNHIKMMLNCIKSNDVFQEK